MTRRETRVIKRQMARVSSLLFVVAVIVSCADKSDCEKICTHFAECKLKAQQGGERMMGERKMPPDPACMDRCAKGGDAFAACEGAKKTCVDVLACSGTR